MKELLAGDVGARPIQHCDDEVLGKLEVQAATTLWMRKNSELKGRARAREEADEMQSPEPALDARF
jgi:hypothetical protein